MSVDPGITAIRGNVTFQYAVDFETALTIASIANSADPVATFAAGAVTDALGGDAQTEARFALVQIGWEDWSDSVFMLEKDPDSGEVKLLGMNSTDPARFPAGASGGKLLPILNSSWKPIPYVQDFDFGQSEPNTVEINLLTRRKAISIFNGYTSSQISMTMIRKEGDTQQEEVAVNFSRIRKGVFKFEKLARPGQAGVAILSYGDMQYSVDPTLQDGSVLANSLTVFPLNLSVEHKTPAL